MARMIVKVVEPNNKRIPNKEIEVMVQDFSTKRDAQRVTGFLVGLAQFIHPAYTIKYDIEGD